MAGHLASVPHTPRDENIQTPPISREILEILFEVVPHMPTESQESFVSMLRDNDSNPPSHGALKVPPRRPHLSLLPDSLHNYVQEKTIQHLSESDLAFEAKQQVAAKTSRESDKRKGVTKRYDKPQKNQARKERALMMVFPLMNPNTTPPRVPWSNGSASVPVNRHMDGISSSSVPHFYHMNPTRPGLSSIPKGF